MIASRVSGRATSAEDAKIRRCVVRASSSPPPSARDDKAVMVGIGRAAIVEKVERRVFRNCSVLRVHEVLAVKKRC